MSDDSCDIVTHVWDANNTWMFKSLQPKFGPDKFMGQLPGTVTEMNRPEYRMVGPGYYNSKWTDEHLVPNPGMKATALTTNCKNSHIRDNGVDRMDYRTGFELGRIPETLKNPMLSPAKYEADTSGDTANPSNWEGIGVLDNTDIRFKPTPIADIDLVINAEMDAGGTLMRESPGLVMARKDWLSKGCPLDTTRRGLLPKTPVPHMRRSASCPPQPDKFLKKGNGMTITEGITQVREQRHATQRFHDAFYNTRRVAGSLGPSSPPQYPHIRTKKETKTREWMREETRKMAATAPQILNRTRCVRYKREPALTAGCSKHSLDETFSKSTPTNKTYTMAQALKEAGNISKCSFDSTVERDVENIRAAVPHLTEMSKREYADIGPGAYKVQMDNWSPKFPPSGKGFGTGSRGLTHDAAPRAESFIAGKKRHRNLALSMFSTGYLRKSHRTPTTPQATQMLT